MELASHTSLDVSSRLAAIPVVVHTGILRDSPGRGAVNAQDLRWHSSEQLAVPTFLQEAAALFRNCNLLINKTIKKNLK